MEDMEKLKRAILGIEKSAYEMEQYPFTMSAYVTADYLRIAAACMWEKLERLEKEAGTC